MEIFRVIESFYLVGTRILKGETLLFNEADSSIVIIPDGIDKNIACNKVADTIIVKGLTKTRLKENCFEIKIV